MKTKKRIGYWAKWGNNKKVAKNVVILSGTIEKYNNTKGVFCNNFSYSLSKTVKETMKELKSYYKDVAKDYNKFKKFYDQETKNFNIDMKMLTSLIQK